MDIDEYLSRLSFKYRGMVCKLEKKNEMAEIRRKEETLFEFCLDILLFGLRYIGGKGNDLRSIMYKLYRRRSFVSITINDSLRNIKNNDRNRSKSNSKRETSRFFP